MNCIIFKGQEGEVDAVWELGVDVFANEIGFGPGKRYPGGPTTVVNGKEIPCVFSASPSASMTDKILAKVMKRLDDFGLT